MTPPSVSRHLSGLENAGVVAGEGDGQKVLHRLNPKSGEHMIGSEDERDYF
jgi:DNA-binding transcriptional ArsR family regulator